MIVSLAGHELIDRLTYQDFTMYPDDLALGAKGFGNPLLWLLAPFMPVTSLTAAVVKNESEAAAQADITATDEAIRLQQGTLEAVAAAPEQNPYYDEYKATSPYYAAYNPTPSATPAPAASSSGIRSKEFLIPAAIITAAGFFIK